MPGRGRNPVPRGIFSIEQAELFTPPKVVLDTSFIFEALAAVQPHHRACESFFERLGESSSVVHFNRLAEIELAEVAFRSGLRERYPKGQTWMRYRHDGRSRRLGRRSLQETLARWHDLLASLRWVRVELDEVASQVPDLMVRYGLSSYDAVHLSTAIHVGVRDLVTLDAGFAAVPARLLTLHVNEGRLRRCRQLRSSRREMPAPV